MHQERFMRFIIITWIFVIAFIGINAQEVNTLIVGDTSYTYVDPDFELLDASAKGDTTKIEAFLKIGIDVNTTTWDGVTPLMYAAQNGHLRTVEILIDAGAKVDLKPYNKIDALMGATIAGHVYVVDTLILNGAYVDTRNIDGLTPLMYASAYGYDTLTDVLLFYGARVNLNDNYGNEPIHFSTFYGNLGITDKLLQHGANIHATDFNGFTPLMIAAQNGYTGLVAFLLDNGADINTTNHDNADALSLAIVNRQYPVIELLIERGAVVDRNISEKVSTYKLARIKGDRYIRELLLANGAHEEKGLLPEHFVIDFETDWNGKDLMIGGQVGLMELKSRVQITAGYLTRPTVRSVLIEELPSTYYQYWESRSYFHLGGTKFLKLRQTGFNASFGAYAGLHFAYTYGNYRGSNQQPDEQFLLLPKAGIYYDLGILRMKAGYEYMNLNNSKASPHRINMSIGLNFGTIRNPVQPKEEPEL